MLWEEWLCNSRELTQVWPRHLYLWKFASNIWILQAKTMSFYIKWKKIIVVHNSITNHCHQHHQQQYHQQHQHPSFRACEEAEDHSGDETKQLHDQKTKDWKKGKGSTALSKTIPNPLIPLIRFQFLKVPGYHVALGWGPPKFSPPGFFENI